MKRRLPYWLCVMLCLAVVIVLLLVFAGGGPLVLYGVPFE